MHGAAPMKDEAERAATGMHERQHQGGELGVADHEHGALSVHLEFEPPTLLGRHIGHECTVCVLQGDGPPARTHRNLRALDGCTGLVHHETGDRKAWRQCDRASIDNAARWRQRESTPHRDQSIRLDAQPYLVTGPWKRLRAAHP